MANGWGGHREGSGRKKGGHNRDGAAELRALARDFSQAALLKAAQLAGILPKKDVNGNELKDGQGNTIYYPAATGETAQLTAINIVLDRAYGKPKEVLEIETPDEGEHADALTEAIQSKLDRITESGATGSLPQQLNG